MYNAVAIQSAFLGLIGWRQNDSPDNQRINALTDSDSGLYYNDFHPDLTYDNLYSVAPNYVKVTHTAWDNAENYTAGDLVTDGGINYVALSANVNKPPADNPDIWLTQFTKWLKDRTEAGIIEALRLWVRGRLKERAGATLLEQDKIFRAGAISGTNDVNNGRLTGYELVPTFSKYAKGAIDQLSLHLTEAQDVDVYLFNSLLLAPVKTTTLSYTTAGSVQWFSLTDWQLNGEGTYFIVMDQGNLSGQSINTVQDFSHMGQPNYYPRSKFFSVSAFSVDGDGSALWDVTQNTYSRETNYGINLNISVHCDYTELFLTNKMVFLDLIYAVNGGKFLSEIIHNPNVRANRNIVNAKSRQLATEVHGDAAGRPGKVEKEIEMIIETTVLDFSNLDTVCLPCVKRSGAWRLA